MSRVILLDAGPLGIVTKRRGVPDAEACRAWVARCLRQGARIFVPAIAYYEQLLGNLRRKGFVPYEGNHMMLDAIFVHFCSTLLWRPRSCAPSNYTFPMTLSPL
jgi:hypothetical protein